MIFFTADTHFGHKNIIELCNRPFSSVEEMDEIMVQNWNAKVKGNDTVYIIGDMFFRAQNPESILKRLKGKKKLIIGNHDGSWMTKLKADDYFVSINNYLEVSDGKRSLVLCHYPLVTWKHEKKSFMIHGHIHADKSEDYWPAIAKRSNMLNAGADINGYQPVTFDELVENNILFKKL